MSGKLNHSPHPRRPTQPLFMNWSGERNCKVGLASVVGRTSKFFATKSSSALDEASSSSYARHPVRSKRSQPLSKCCLSCAHPRKQIFCWVVELLRLFETPTELSTKCRSFVNYFSFLIFFCLAHAFLCIFFFTTSNTAKRVSNDRNNFFTDFICWYYHTSNCFYFFYFFLY